ncbi:MULTISPECIES: hypothetical protein [Rhizobium]|uniref:hypothetical protein n=1 Tax=Rhizobium TaxID=379 RepID=UPI0013D5F83E|nr:MULTISPECIES: hypothetical protein [Rhizobium]MBY5810063.1 hypothetical protein [Rhizobium leguminosarum]
MVTIPESIKTSQRASALDDLVSAGLQSCEFGPVEFLFQHVKDIIVNLVGAAHRRQLGRSWAAATVWRLLPVKGETAGYA